MPQGISFARLVEFVRAHLRWVLLGPLVMLFGTTLHELTHAGAALLSGGRFMNLRLLPTYRDRFYFGYVFTEGGDGTWIKAAPAYLSACIAVFAHAWLPTMRPSPVAKLCFILFYLLPLFDLSMGVLGPLMGVETDLASLHPSRGLLAATAAIYFAIQLAFAVRVFEPIFGTVLSRVELRLMLLVLVLSPALRFL